MLRADHPGSSHSGNQNVRTACYRRKIHGPGMTDRDGGVLPQQQHGYRFSYDERAADDHGFLSAAVNSVIIQNFHAGLRSAGREAQLLSREHAGQR